MTVVGTGTETETGMREQRGPDRQTSGSPYGRCDNRRLTAIVSKVGQG